MMETLALDRLPEGRSAYVTEVQNEPSMTRRLAELGLIRGTRVTCLCRSPAGDPAAYLIRGAVIALRGRDAAWVQVEPEPDPAPAQTARTLA
jgi:ferrous iron transport protein A